MHTRRRSIAKHLRQGHGYAPTYTASQPEIVLLDEHGRNHEFLIEDHVHDGDERGWNDWGTRASVSALHPSIRTGLLVEGPWSHGAPGSADDSAEGNKEASNRKRTNNVIPLF